MTAERERALAVFPAGISNGEFGLPDDGIVVMARGEGCRLCQSYKVTILDKRSSMIARLEEQLGEMKHEVEGLKEENKNLSYSFEISCQCQI